MMLRRSLISACLVCCLAGSFVLACSGDDDDTGSKGNGGNGSGGVANAGGADASSGGSSGSSGAGAGGGATGGAAGSAGSASGGSSGSASGGAAGQPSDAGSDSGCDYLDLDIYLVDCGTEHAYLRRWTDLSGNPTCPDYWTLSGQSQQFPTQAAALASDNCDETCVRSASTSVSLLKCGVKTGYIVFHAEGCPDVLETPDGFFSSVEEWNQQVPCP
jgi:hypothetical protein